MFWPPERVLLFPELFSLVACDFLSDELIDDRLFEGLREYSSSVKVIQLTQLSDLSGLA